MLRLVLHLLRFYIRACVSVSDGSLSFLWLMEWNYENNFYICLKQTVSRQLCFLVLVILTLIAVFIERSMRKPLLVYSF